MGFCGLATGWPSVSYDHVSTGGLSNANLASLGVHLPDKYSEVKSVLPTRQFYFPSLLRRHQIGAFSWLP